jgi:hypothetical protein
MLDDMYGWWGLLQLQVKEVQLTNPTRRPLSYSVRLEGQPDFSLESQMIKIDPGRSTQVGGEATHCSQLTTLRTGICCLACVVVESLQDNSRTTASAGLGGVENRTRWL